MRQKRGDQRRHVVSFDIANEFDNQWDVLDGFVPPLKFIYDALGFCFCCFYERTATALRSDKYLCDFETELLVAIRHYKIGMLAVTPQVPGRSQKPGSFFGKEPLSFLLHQLRHGRVICLG